MAQRKQNPPRPVRRPSRRGKASRSFKISHSPSKAFPPEAHLLLLLGFLLVVAVFLQYEPFQWLGSPLHLPLDHLRFLLELAALLLFLGFFLGLQGLPDKTPLPDLPRWAAYPLLLSVLALTAFLRFYRADQAMGRYWDDPAICIIDPCNIVQLHIFRIDFAIGHREPLYPYLAAGVWWFFPQMKALVVERLSSTLFDVGAVWVFYRLGREVAGQRLAGLFFAALGAVSKPMIMQNLTGMPGLILPFIIGMVMWFQFRLFRKPDLPHFLQWGFLLGFGFYTYIAYRPWALFLAFLSLVWIVFRPKEQAIQASGQRASGRLSPAVHWAFRALLALGMAGVFLFLLDRMFVVFYDNPVSKLWRMNVWVWLLLQAVFFAALGYFYLRTQGKERLVVAWGLAVLLTGFLVYPLAMNAEIGIKIQDNRIHFHNLKEMTDQFVSWIRFLFYTGDDRSDMNVEGDPFFDCPAAALAFAGLVFTAARPSWPKLFLLLCAFTGSVGRILTVDPTSAKVLGSLPALLLLPSWGLSAWVSASFTGTWKRKWVGILLSAGLAAFWAWEGYGSFERVYVKWWNILRPDILVSREISDLLPTKRVYMGVYNGMGFASPAVESVIHDGEPLYLLQKTNVIDVLPEETRKDVVVLIDGLDREWAPILKKDFPKAQWLPRWEYYQNPNDIPCLEDVVIPAKDIPEKPGKIFMFRVAPNKNWLRRVYETYYGLGRGMISYEDASSTLNPFPTGWGGRSASAEGDWEAPADGDYTFSANTPNPVQVWVDGKLALSSITADWVRPRLVSHTLFLTKGTHHVRYVTFMRVDAWFDRVTLQNKKTGYQSVLGE